MPNQRILSSSYCRTLTIRKLRGCNSNCCLIAPSSCIGASRSRKKKFVERITRLGDSDKSNEVHKIGSFGIGFKSVFAVTERPEVYCRLDGQPFAFAIEELIVPVPLLPTGRQGDETLFLLPYSTKQGVDRSSEAAAQLARTGPEVLMFLNHIEELVWEDSAGNGEQYRCVRGAEKIILSKSH